MKKTSLQKLLAIQALILLSSGAMASKDNTIDEVYEESELFSATSSIYYKTKTFELPLSKCPQTLTATQFDELRNNGNPFRPKPVQIEGIPFINFFYKGDISAIYLKNQLPIDHLRLSSFYRDCNQEILNVYQASETLSFKIDFDVFLSDNNNTPIKGSEKYGQPFSITLEGIITDIEAFKKYLAE